MSLADNLFINMCNDILENGTSTENQKVRPIWTDTYEPAYTIKQFGVVNRYDLQKEFPALTLRKTGIKSSIAEILWIFQKKSNNIKDLTLNGKQLHIWDEWADFNGSIGKAYGYQIGEDYIHHKDSQNNRIILDQMDAVLYDLKNVPFSRRIMTQIFNLKELHEMNLQPCCWNCVYNVTDKGYDKLVLNMVLNQRSNDVLAANNWNVVQYSALLMMVAQACNMIPGELLHVITDAHIYDRHVPIVRELIQRPTFDAPKVTLNPAVTNFYHFVPDDFKIENYLTGPSVGTIPIAV